MASIVTEFVAEAKLPGCTLHDAGQPWLRLQAVTKLLTQLPLSVDADLDHFANLAQTTSDPTCRYVNGAQIINFYGFGLLVCSLCERHQNSARLALIREHIHAVAAELFAPRFSFLTNLFPESAPLAQPYALEVKKTAFVATRIPTHNSIVPTVAATAASLPLHQVTEKDKMAVRKHVPVFVRLVCDVADENKDGAPSRKRQRTTTAAEPGQVKGEEEHAQDAWCDQLGCELAWTLPLLVRAFPSKYPTLQHAGRWLMGELKRARSDTKKPQWISQLYSKHVSLERFRQHACKLV